MTIRCLHGTFAVTRCKGRHLCHHQEQNPSSQRWCQARPYVTQHLSYSPDGLCCWQIDVVQSRTVRGWLFRPCQLRHGPRLREHVSLLSTSASCLCADRGSGMWRLKGTLDSVRRAIGGSHVDLLSRITRLKSGEAEGAKGATLSTEGKGGSPGIRAAPGKAPGAEVGKLHSGSNPKAIRKPEEVTAKPVKDTAGPVQPFELFHPSKFTANLGETYNYLAHHINAYFGYATKPEDAGSTHEDDDRDTSSSLSPGKGSGGSTNRLPVPLPAKGRVSVDGGSPPPLLPPATAPPDPSLSPKKGIGHYLSYSGPTVQAFVGSYIAHLVPKLRPNARGLPATKEGLPSGEEPVQKQAESVETREQKALEDRARRLLLQREKIIARVSVDNRTRALVQALRRASDVRLYITRVEDLSYHLLEFPETRGVALKEQVLPCLLRLRQAGDQVLQAVVREALALVGYTDPVKGRGIRLLSIDGGGTRGVLALQTLRKLEELTGRPTYQLFDYICGVSTGAILAFMLGVYQMSLDECEALYRRLGSDVFKQNVIVGTVKMGWRHAFYDSEVWEAILKERMGSDLMVETSRNPNCPKVAAVSTIVNRGPPPKAYVFRNYNLPPGVRSHYLGGCQHKVWEAIRASSAAPGYFQEFALGNDLHQDGGLLVNNPTAVALHESQCLWPNTRLQCVVSLGTGRLETAGQHSGTHTSLKTKLSHVISSATDTEEVHTMLDALLPPDTYFRFNPCLSEDVPLDEPRGEKLALLQADGERYLGRNERKMCRAARLLLRDKGALQRLAEWAALKRDSYQGLQRVPFLSRS